ncbi:CoxG family protein [Desertimonas flava]|uniref:CoxG family protein n=1 Tax=Desertimonas flava TaxID=2064846 RepID=UPI0013C4A96A|nr:SRPBCC domain-containing protein [Desertimonas flava]
MARETLSQDLIVAAPTEAIWPRLIDVTTVASWLPILHHVTERAPLSHYDAVLQDKVGPFSLKADLAIDVVDVVEGRRIAVRATGEDRQVRSRIVIDAAVDLVPVDDSSTQVTASGTYEITGKVATLGAGTIRTKARKLVDEFCSAASVGLVA